MRDGSSYSGDFQNGEIIGRGMRVQDDGTEYVGDFHMGEKHGYGEITYGTRNIREEWYKGKSGSTYTKVSSVPIDTVTIFKYHA